MSVFCGWVFFVYPQGMPGSNIQAWFLQYHLSLKITAAHHDGILLMVFSCKASFEITVGHHLWKSVFEYNFQLSQLEIILKNALHRWCPTVISRLVHRWCTGIPLFSRLANWIPQSNINIQALKLQPDITCEAWTFCIVSSLIVVQKITPQVMFGPLF